MFFKISLRYLNSVTLPSEKYSLALTASSEIFKKRLVDCVHHLFVMFTSTALLVFNYVQVLVESRKPNASFSWVKFCTLVRSTAQFWQCWHTQEILKRVENTFCAMLQFWKANKFRETEKKRNFYGHCASMFEKTINLRKSKCRNESLLLTILQERVFDIHTA